MLSADRGGRAFYGLRLRPLGC